MSEQATAEQLADLNPNILKYPCSYFGNGILPEPLIADYKYRHAPSIARSKMDLGLSTMRRRTRISPMIVPLSFLMTGEQKEVFESWIYNALDGGVNWFYLPLLTGDFRLEIHKVQFTQLPGEDTDFELVSYSKAPVIKGMGGGRLTLWRLKAEVQGYRSRKLAVDMLPVLDKNSVLSLERAAWFADTCVNNTVDIESAEVIK